jgi:tetratricopeptide (TPR) repeat protein
MFGYKYKQYLSIKIIYILGLFTCPVQGDVQFILKIAEHLGRTDFHDEAITEYFRVLFWAKDSSSLSLAYMGMGQQYREMGQWEKAADAFRQSISFSTSGNAQCECQLALATTLLISHQYSAAMMELLPLTQLTDNDGVKSRAIIELTIAAVLQHNWALADNQLSKLSDIITKSAASDSAIVFIKTELSKAPAHKSEDRAKWLSTFLPGSGQLYGNDYRNAINAFLLNSLNFSVIFTNLYNAQYQAAIVYFIFVAERYYAGNRARAYLITRQNNEKMDQDFSEKIIKQLQSLYTEQLHRR